VIKLVKSSIEKNILPTGELHFIATPEKPLIYYTGKTDDIGRVNITKENKNRKVLIIPIE
jgi:hypothetical protein